jgi:hypothetical protein
VTATTTASALARPRIPVPSSIRLGGGGCQDSRARAAAARQGQRWGSRSECRWPGPAHRRRRDASTPSLRALFLRAVGPSRPSPWSPAVADLLSPGDPADALVTFAAALGANPATLLLALAPALRAAVTTISLAACHHLHLIALFSASSPPTHTPPQRSSTCTTVTPSRSIVTPGFKGKYECIEYMCAMIKLYTCIDLVYTKTQC